LNISAPFQLRRWAAIIARTSSSVGIASEQLRRLTTIAAEALP
jgi:hypothetical protein